MTPGTNPRRSRKGPGKRCTPRWPPGRPFGLHGVLEQRIPTGAFAQGRIAANAQKERQEPRGCYGLMMTRAPMSTWAYSASESEMYIRMQPCEAYVPIDDELNVPWMRIPGALR